MIIIKQTIFRYLFRKTLHMYTGFNPNKTKIKTDRFYTVKQKNKCLKILTSLQSIALTQAK